jgi:hypothetical protein
MRKSSISFWDVTLMPDLMRAGAIVSLTFATAFETPLRRELKGFRSCVRWTWKESVHTFADVVALVSVAEFDSFVNTGGRAWWNSGAESAYTNEGLTYEH